jgi:hypothetical protein
MGIAEGTVRMRIMRARQILKHKFLAPYSSIDPLAGVAAVAAAVWWMRASAWAGS